MKSACVPAADFYIGVVAEGPSDRNKRRYLVFFDDGYAQYCWHRELRQADSRPTGAVSFSN